jgi:hypothetical protein
MDVARLVLAEGDQVSAWGRLIRDGDATWFEPPQPELLIMLQDPPIRPPWRGAVRVDYANLDDVAEQREREGLLEGWARISGSWTGSLLRAELQDQQRPPPEEFPDWEEPPCPPPAGGWPRQRRGAGWENPDVDLGDLRDTGAAVAVTVFRPRKSQPVLVVAATDAGAVEAVLRPQLGPRLCIVPSRWTRAQLREIHDQLFGHWDDWNIFRGGELNASDGQPYLTASFTMVLPEMAAWARDVPDGILVLDPWLAPGQR